MVRIVPLSSRLWRSAAACVCVAGAAGLLCACTRSDETWAGPARYAEQEALKWLLAEAPAHAEETAHDGADASDADEQPQDAPPDPAPAEEPREEETPAGDAPDIPPPGDLRPIPPILTAPRAGTPAATGSAQEATPAEPIRTLDSFDKGLNWRPVRWSNSNDAKVSIVEGAGNRALKLVCYKGEGEKAGVVWAPEKRQDLRAFKTFALDVSVLKGTGVSVALALQTSALFESQPVALLDSSEGAAVVPVYIPLAGEGFKTAPQWEFGAALRDAHDVRGLHLVFYSQDECVVLVDNVRVMREAARPAEQTH